MEQIRVCTYDGPGARPVIRSVPWPKIPKKAALIKVGACGVCGTDLHIMHGAMDGRINRPAVIGHEMSGRIGGLGEGVDGLAVGQPVTVMPLDCCGQCRPA